MSIFNKVSKTFQWGRQDGPSWKRAKSPARPAGAVLVEH